MLLYLFQVPRKTHLKEFIFIDVQVSYSPFVCLSCYHSNWSSRGSYFLIKCSDQLVLNTHIFCPRKRLTFVLFQVLQLTFGLQQCLTSIIAHSMNSVICTLAFPSTYSTVCLSATCLLLS